MAQNILGLIESVLGDELTPDSMVTIQKKPHDFFCKLKKVHEELERNYTLPELRPDEVRPYVPIIHQGTQFSGITLSYYGDFDSIASAETATDSLTQHLLYCHSIAVDNPLAFMLDYFPGNDRFTEEIKPKIFNYLHFICSIRPLIDEGIVHLVEWSPKRLFAFGSWPPLLFDKEDLGVVAKETDWSDMQDCFKVSVDSVPVEAKAIFLGSEISPEIGAVLGKSKTLGGNFSVYLPRRCYQSLFSHLVRKGNELLQTIQPNGEHDMLLTAELLALDLPRLNNLSLGDLVAIRRSEDVFEDWRRSLRRGLREASRLDPCLLGRENTALQAIRDELAELARRAGLATTKSRVLSSVRQGAKGFAVDTLAALIASPTAVSAAITAGGIKGGLEFLWNHLTAHTPTTQAKVSLQKHIVACSR